MGRVRRFSMFAAVGSVAAIEGCATWRQPRTTTGGSPVISTERPLRVTLASGNEMVLANPRQVGDSLVGEVGKPANRMAVGMSDVKRLEERTQGSSLAKGVGIGCASSLAIFFILGALLSGS